MRSSHLEQREWNELEELQIVWVSVAGYASHKV